MKRKSVRIQAAKAKTQKLEEEEERNTLMTHMMSATSLLSLPPELVVMVASNGGLLPGFCLLLQIPLGHSGFTTPVECSFEKDRYEQQVDWRM